MHWPPEWWTKACYRSGLLNAREVQNRKSLHLIRSNCGERMNLFLIWVKIRYENLSSCSLLDPHVAGTQSLDNHKLCKFWFSMLRLVQNMEALPCWKAALNSQRYTHTHTDICRKVILTLASGKHNFTDCVWFLFILRLHHTSSILKMWFWLSWNGYHE